MTNIFQFIYHLAAFGVGAVLAVSVYGYSLENKMDAFDKVVFLVCVACVLGGVINAVGVITR